jgi:hypothetical protein
LALIALIALLALPAPQAVGLEGAVTGTLTLNGVPVAIDHVYATAQPGFFDKKSEDVHVLLSDVALSDEARSDVFALSKLARNEDAHIVEVVIDAEGSPIGGSLFAKAFDGMVSAAGMHKFTRERLEHGAIAGRLSVGEPHTFMGVTWQYDVRFTAPIPRPPTAEERSAALASPAALAAGQYVAAVRRAKLDAFLATLTPSAAADFKGADGPEKLKELAADMPVDTKVVDLVPQTDGSVLASVEGHRPEDGMAIGYTLKIVEVGGHWKVGK